VDPNSIASDYDRYYYLVNRRDLARPSVSELANYFNDGATLSICLLDA